MTRRNRTAGLCCFLAIISISARAQSASDEEYKCLSLLAVLPISANSRMQELMGNDELLRRDGAKALVKAIQGLADHGIADAQVSLGVMYRSGYCLPIDSAHATELYKQAAESGSALAQHELGVNYLFGAEIPTVTRLVVPPDSAKGLFWINKAADQDYTDAQYVLAQVYSTGREGIPQDLVNAYMWYSVLGVKTELQKLAQRLTTEQIAQAERRAREWITAHPQRAR